MSDGEGNFSSERPDRGPMDQFSAHLDRGWDMVSRGDFRAAQVSAEKSIELDAESPEAYNLLGYVRAAQGDHDSALQHYRQAIALDDSFVEAMLNAAEVLIHPLHDFDAAITMVEDALDWADGADEVADALLLKFDAFMHQGDRDAALQVLKTLPSEGYESPRLDFLVGRAHFELGQLDPAASLLRSSVEREPDNPDAHYYLALTLDAMSDQQGATLEFLKARELDLSMPRVFWAPTTQQFEQALRSAIGELSEAMAAVLKDTLVVVSDSPGAEVVVDGVDPRAGLLLDTHAEASDPPRAGRLFIYQRNVERMIDAPEDLEEGLKQLLEQEIAATFPSLAPPADAGDAGDASDGSAH